MFKHLGWSHLFITILLWLFGEKQLVNIILASNEFTLYCFLYLLIKLVKLLLGLASGKSAFDCSTQRARSAPGLGRDYKSL